MSRWCLASMMSRWLVMAFVMTRNEEGKKRWKKTSTPVVSTATVGSAASNVCFCAIRKDYVKLEWWEMVLWRNIKTPTEKKSISKWKMQIFYDKLMVLLDIACGGPSITIMHLHLWWNWVMRIEMRSRESCGWNNPRVICVKCGRCSRCNMSELEAAEVKGHRKREEKG